MARPKKTMKFDRLQVYLSPDLTQKIERYADESRMKVSVYIRSILEHIFLTNKELIAHNDRF